MREILLKQLIIFIITLNMSLSFAHAKLVGHWAFDENSGNWAHDTLGQNDAYLSSSDMWSSSEKEINGALEFDGTEVYAQIPNDLVFAFNKEMTVACRVKMSDVNRNAKELSRIQILTKGKGGYLLLWDWSKKEIEFKCFGLRGKNGKSVRCARDIEDGRWHHIAGVFDGKKLYIYIDGQLGNHIEVSGTIAQNESPIFVGYVPHKRRLPFEGLIDDIAIFDHALDAKEVSLLFKEGGSFFVPKLALSVLDDKKTLAQKKPLDAVKFLEKKILEKEGLIEKTGNLAHSERVLISEFYCMLAQSMEDAGMPKEKVIEVYTKVACRPMNKPNCIKTFLWLFKNLDDNEKVEIVRKSVTEGVSTVQNIYYVADYLRRNEDEDSFRFLLEGIISASNSLGHADALVRGVGKNDRWFDRIWKYCLERNELTLSAMHIGDMLAEHYVQKEDFLKAASIYRGINGRTANDQYKITHEFRETECLFKAERYSEVLPRLQKFIKNNKSTHRILVIQAMMMLAKAQIQLGDLEKAVSALLKLTIEYPTSIEAGEATYLMGYCYMLQNEFESAKAAFNLVVEEYPGNAYTKKARKYLKRISSFNN